MKNNIFIKKLSKFLENLGNGYVFHEYGYELPSPSADDTPPQIAPVIA